MKVCIALLFYLLIASKCLNVVYEGEVINPTGDACKEHIDIVRHPDPSRFGNFVLKTFPPEDSVISGDKYNGCICTENTFQAEQGEFINDIDLAMNNLSLDVNGVPAHRVFAETNGLIWEVTDEIGGEVKRSSPDPLLSCWLDQSPQGGEKAVEMRFKHASGTVDSYKWSFLVSSAD